MNHYGIMLDENERKNFYFETASTKLCWLFMFICMLDTYLYVGVTQNQVEFYICPQIKQSAMDFITINEISVRFKLIVTRIIKLEV